MIEYKVSTNILVPVVLTNAISGLAHTGVTTGSVTVTVIKSDGSNSTFTPFGSQWTEQTAGVFASGGFYLLTIPSANTNLVGFLAYGVGVSGDDTYFNVVDIVANLESDTFTRIGAPTGPTVSADIAAVAANAAAANAAATNAFNEAVTINNNVGVSALSGTLAADISATYHAVLNISGGGGGSGSADLTPVLVALSGVRNTLGQPVVSVARDILEVARIVRHPSLQAKK